MAKDRHAPLLPFEEKLTPRRLHLPPHRSYDYQHRWQFRHYKGVTNRVRARSGGICEICHRNEATEFHHTYYPRWTNWTVPEDLLHLCLWCHNDEEENKKLRELADAEQDAEDWR